MFEPPRRRVFAAALLLCAAAVVPYGNVLHADFTLDDFSQIRSNRMVTAGVDVIGSLASALYPGDLYRPFTVLTFAVNEALAPAHAGMFHAVNVLLHAAVTLLLFALVQRLFAPRVAWVAALLFAVHPIHTEAVSSIVGRAELLAAGLGIVALLASLEARRATTQLRRRVCDVVSLFAFALALLSKEPALTVLPLLVLLRAYDAGGELRRSLKLEMRNLHWLPYAACAVVYLLLRQYVISAQPLAVPLLAVNNPLAFLPWHLRLAGALGVLWDYALLLAWPLHLSADYSAQQVPLLQGWLEPRCMAGAALLTALVLLVWRSRSAALQLIVSWLLLTLMLTANLWFPIGTIKAERLLYLPSAGFCMGIAMLAVSVVQRASTRIGAALLALVVALLAARTWQRNFVWQDNTSLFTATVRDAPRSAKANYNYGVVLQREGNDQAAASMFAKALELAPYAPAAVGLGIAEAKQGDLEAAVKAYVNAVELQPDHAQALGNLCATHVYLRRYADAVRWCRAVLRRQPGDPEGLRRLAYASYYGGAPALAGALLARINQATGAAPAASQALPSLPRQGDKSTRELPADVVTQREQ